jgi:hypothetical protein
MIELRGQPRQPWMCDAEWEIDKLRSAVQDKLQKSKEAQALRDQIAEMGIYVTQVTPTACGFRPLGLERI